MRADEHLILHALAVKRLATPDEVADVAAADPDVVRTTLEANVASGRVLDMGGKFSLSPGGRMIVKGEYSRHFANLRASDDFTAAYDRFEQVNEDVKSIITSWQVRELPSGESITNDHSDKDYDAKVIDRLGAVHDRFTPTLEQMGKELPRIDLYRDKLDTALEKAEQGDTRWVSEVALPSYHTVWFELHEDLLCLLGRTRVE